tara:strand:- start:903 stop:1316 length:414 start_codon:yes stop_codon:yes gene_type:complete
MCIQGDIAKLIDWADQKGYVVLLDRYGDDSICYESRIISIKSTRKEEIQLHTLLHECGHLLVHKNGSVHEFDLVKDIYRESSQIVKTYNVIEEIEAWKRGRTLANKLDIEINEEKWQREVSRAITKYMKWALSVPPF